MGASSDEIRARRWAWVEGLSTSTAFARMRSDCIDCVDSVPQIGGPHHDGCRMATLTIRNLEDDVKARLRVRAATHGHSMEEEVRVILKRAVGGVTGAGLWALSRQLFEGDKGVELEALRRDADRAAPDFSNDGGR